MGKINSKQKGKRGELEFCRLCRDQGYEVRRTAQYCGNTGDAADCVGLPGIHVEVKRVEKLNVYAAMAQAVHDSEKSGKIPIVAHRKNDHPWLIVMQAGDWFQLYREWELSKPQTNACHCETSPQAGRGNPSTSVIANQSADWCGNP